VSGTRDLDHLLSVAMEAVEAGCAIVRDAFGGEHRARAKAPGDWVSAVDVASEQAVRESLLRAAPDVAFFGEEGGGERGELGWYVDPLDGTTNFVHRLPHFAVSLAFYEDGQPVAGCVFNPLLDECYTARRGGGAFLNGARIACSRQTDLKECLLTTGFHYKLEQLQDNNLQHFIDLALEVRGVRRLGSAALDLCYTADGRYDGFWELHLSAWDVAAGVLIAQEAGCLVTDFSGGTDWLFGGRVLATNPTLHEKVLEVLTRGRPPA
jgi:myo-inositol-1(or 4)-monophosphatase